MKKNLLIFVSLIALILVISSCGTTSSTSVEAAKGGSINKTSSAPATPSLKKTISVAKFTTGLADNNSPAYTQAAYDTLVNKLQGTGKFIVFEESEFDTLNSYIQSTGGTGIQKHLAQYMIVGTVNSVANKTTGGSFFGISSNTTTTEASVTLRLIDTSTGQIIYAEEGQGSASNMSTPTMAM